MGVWELSAAQRAETVQRLQKNIDKIAFVREVKIGTEHALKAATAIERKAYSTAQVEARTTTGARPLAETTKAYARKIGQLVTELVLAGCVLQDNANTAQGDTVDLSHGAREFLTKEHAEDLLSPMLQENASVKRIRFSTKSFGIDAAHVAASAIENCKTTLHDADISDIIAGRPESDALEVLHILSAALSKCSLASLNLSDNALGEKGVRACKSVLTSSGLFGLSLQNVGCSINACNAVNELVRGDKLRQLSLYNNMSGDEGAEHIAKLLARCPMMEDFRMVSSRVGPDGAAALTRSLCSSGATACLRKFDIHDNPMTEDIAEHVAKLITSSPNLVMLNLNDTGLTDTGVCVIAQALMNGAPNLEELHLALNEITPEAAESLAVSLVAKSKLQVLDLSENELEDAGTSFIARALEPNKVMRVLDLRTNQIRKSALAAAKCIATNKPDFEKLELNDNEMSEDILEQLAAFMKQAGIASKLGALEENMPEDDSDEDRLAVEESDALSKALAALEV